MYILGSDLFLLTRNLKFLKRTFKNIFIVVQNHLLNLLSSAVNPQRLLCRHKAGMKCLYSSFLMNKTYFNAVWFAKFVIIPIRGINNIFWLINLLWNNCYKTYVVITNIIYFSHNVFDAANKPNTIFFNKYGFILYDSRQPTTLSNLSHLVCP